MKTELILVGRTADKHFQAGIDDYAGRIAHYMPFGMTIIPELRNTKSLTEEQQKQAEGELILKQLSPQDTVVLLDERGKELRSVELAQWLQRKQLSLSRLTFSHQMVRLVFTEQLYRACTIIKGEPYHHE